MIYILLLKLPKPINVIYEEKTHKRNQEREGVVYVIQISLDLHKSKLCFSRLM